MIKLYIRRNNNHFYLYSISYRFSNDSNIFTLIDFNVMSTNLALFSDLRFILRSYVYILCSRFLNVFCPQSYRIRIIFKRIYLNHRWNQAIMELRFMTMKSYSPTLLSSRVGVTRSDAY